MAKLVADHSLQVPVSSSSVVSQGSIRGSKRKQGSWTVFDRRYAPDDSFESHLTFALRHEPFDLLFLKRLFEAVGGEPIRSMVTAQPTGRTSRKVWYLYEAFTGQSLDVPDARVGNYVDLLDTAEYFTSTGRMSQRHRVRDNLLGTPEFCPVVRRTVALERFAAACFGEQAKAAIAAIPSSLRDRASRRLARDDIQASWHIERERPRLDRVERLARLSMQAGTRALDVEELERLQLAIIDGDRFVVPGLRRAGGFIGDRDHEKRPVPEFVSARADDIGRLVDGLLSADRRMASEGVDPVVRAACLSFGFVFVHPFNDGNGRLHRLLMQHVLATADYSPHGLPLPLSVTIMERLGDYGRCLKAHTAPLLPLISWEPTADGNVHVLNDTADLYRFGDYTAIAEFLYRCIEMAVTETLPDMIDGLKAYDAAREKIGTEIEMPDNTLSLLVNLVRANGGKLPDAERRGRFAPLTDDEVAFVEETVSEFFAGSLPPKNPSP
jgi:hypothetical protein